MRDRACTAFFLLIILAFIILGLYVIIDQSGNISSIALETSTNTNSILTTTIKKYYSIIGVMFVLSITISLLYLILLRFQTKCMIYTLIIMIFCILSAILIFALIQKNTGLIILMFIAIGIFAVLLWCFKELLEKGIEILHIATKFISEKPSVYFSTIWVFFISILFFIFWIVSVIAVQNKANYKESINMDDR